MSNRQHYATSLVWLNSMALSCLVLLFSIVCPNFLLGVDVDVTSAADSGAGTLREAIGTAVAGDVIVFDIAAPAPTIVLSSPLPALAVDVTFRNDQADDVTLDRNGAAAWDFSTGVIAPTDLNIVTGGVPSADADIVAAAPTTLFGDGTLNGNLATTGTLSPGASSTAGSIGTFEVTGDLDATDSTFNIDVASAGSADLVQVGGNLTLTNAELNPNFVDNDLVAGLSYTILDAASITGTFANAGEVFALPEQPFLEALQNGALPANQFGLLVQDNGLAFESIVSGVNQTSAAIILDELLALGTVGAVTDLRNGSTDSVNLAIAQLSGSIYPSLVGAEINHIQNNLASVRDRVALHGLCADGIEKVFWSRGYGVISQAASVRLQTEGYRQETGGVELGAGLRSSNGWAAYTFAHLANSDLGMGEADQHADIVSRRIGGLIEFRGDQFYALAAAGSGTQEYEVQRSLSAFTGSTFAQSEFDGNSEFGYVELGRYFRQQCYVWGPYAGAYGTRVTLDPVTETGDANFGLSTSGGSGESYRSVLGFSLAQRAHTPMGLATTRFRAGWMHEFGDQFHVFESQVAAAALNSLVDQGVSSGQDWGFIRAQMDMGILLGGQMTGSYMGQYNTKIAIHTGMLGLHWVF